MADCQVTTETFDPTALLARYADVRTRIDAACAAAGKRLCDRGEAYDIPGHQVDGMDVVAVLTKVVQEQQTQLDTQAKQLKAQSELLERQQKQLEKLLTK